MPCPNNSITPILHHSPKLRLGRTFALPVLLALLFAASLSAAPFTAFKAGDAAPADIVLQYNAGAGPGYDWAALTHPRVNFSMPEYRLREAVKFLHEGVRRMTGREPTIRNSDDLARGIVVTLLKAAPADVRDDAEVKQALRNDGSDAYNDREAYFIRSEAKRLLIVANTLDGLVAAMPALLESVGYEVLGMGPNWIHVPAEHRERLVFDLKLSGRPSYYLRQLTPTSGQFYGVGTLQVGPKLQLSDPADESVSVSYPRWAIGSRTYSHSMASFPGHAMYAHHRKLVAEMIRTGSTDGFLTAGNHLGLDADRPAASEANKAHLWINTDAQKTPGHGRVYLSDGKTWEEQKLVGMSVNLDPTAPLAQGVVLEAMKQRAAAQFAANPDEPFVFGTEAEDGAGYARIGEWLPEARRNWYPDYLKAEGVAWPQKYVLHEYRGINQPSERFDHATPADTVFAFNNWLLREFDKWIDSLPAKERVTATGHSKKDLVRTSLYSYAYHDIPPHLNLDPRIRVMIAGYPKHRGLREWKLFATQHDMARAFKVMLPREPSGEYRIISIAYYADHNLEGIPARWSAAPPRIIDDLKGTLDAGVRALAFEMDFNFGKYGLAYYLMSKVLWNANLTPAELDAIRDRWLQRAYGSAWQEMKAYYDFMLIDNYPVNAPAAWAKAVRIIDSADAKLDPSHEPDAQRRLDDLKQYWYFYYLLETGTVAAKSPEMVEFLWKGQMSYMTAMHMAVKRTFGTGNSQIAQVVPDAIRQGPAHYTPEETAAWWRKMLEHWPSIEVANFADAPLADGRRGRDVDLNDLVRVADFQKLTSGKPFLFNSAQAPPTVFVTTARAGEPIGFRFAWPQGEELRFYGPKDVPYGVEFWDRGARRWTPVVDVTLTTAASSPLTGAADKRDRHVVEVQLPAPQTGTYRFEVGRGGFLANLTSLGYDFTAGTYQTRPPFSFPERPQGLTQDPVYLYLPKGTKSLDLEVWDSANKKALQLYRGQSAKGLVVSRDVDISRRGTHRVALETGEDGQLARISGNGFAFPLLYSVPSYWAKSPAELLIPRVVAEADGLKIEE